MLAIKLQRIGRKHQPSYRVVVAEKRSKLAGPPVEDLGSYNPFSKKDTINKERVRYWISVGAKPTPTVHNLLVSKQIIDGPKVKISIRRSKKAAEADSGKSPEKAADGSEPKNETGDGAADDSGSAQTGEEAPGGDKEKEKAETEIKG